MATAEAKSGEPVEVLRREEPLSRESLYDGRIVRALWRIATEDSRVSPTALGATEVYRSFEHGPVHTYEVKTALDYYTEAEFRDTSRRFANEIANYEAQRDR